ncbi:hypothetical protein ATANTOWER_003216, partial [Ataeniobius toweri]|nr:hypothetical protein [Ataeniobius toweri]
WVFVYLTSLQGVTGKCSRQQLQLTRLIRRSLKRTLIFDTDTKSFAHMSEPPKEPLDVFAWNFRDPFPEIPLERRRRTIIFPKPKLLSISVQ